MDFKSIRAGLQVSAAPRKLRDLGKSCRKNKKLQDINEECRLPIADSKNQGIGFLGATLICGPARFDLKSIEERSHAEARKALPPWQRRKGMTNSPHPPFVGKVSLIASWTAGNSPARRNSLFLPRFFRWPDS
jgi:hypothetical protein